MTDKMPDRKPSVKYKVAKTISSWKSVQDATVKRESCQINIDGLPRIAQLFEGLKNRDVELVADSVDKSNVNTKDDRGFTPIHDLVRSFRRKRSDEILTILLKNGADVKAQDEEGNTALHIAARDGRKELCSKLIDHLKVNVSDPVIDLLNKKKKTPMHLAAEQGQHEIVKLLLKEGANAKLRDSSNHLSLHYAASKGYPECCKLLCDTYPHNAKQNSNPPPPLILAAREGYEWCLENMGNLTPEDINFKDTKSITALHIACKKGYSKFVDKLIKRQANLEMEDALGMRPIMNSISKFGTSCLTSLIKNGAYTLGINNEKKGLLHIAAERKADECMKVLLEVMEVQNMIDKKDKNGHTALYIALKKDCDKCALMLLENGASPKIECQKKITPLHLATTCTKLEVLSHLLTVKDLDHNTEDDIEAQSPLHYAAKRGSREACLKLLKRGARITVTDKNNRTALHISAYHGYSDLVKILIKRGVKVQAKDTNNATALHAAAKQGHLECCKMIVDAAGKLCTEMDGKGRHPLDLAFKNDHFEVFGLLLNHVCCKSPGSLPADLGNHIHGYMHKALKEKKRKPTEIILKSELWVAGLGFSVANKHLDHLCENFREIIRLFPDLANLVMDKCIEKDIYNFRIFEDNYHMNTGNMSNISTYVWIDPPGNEEHKSKGSPNKKKKGSKSINDTESEDDPFLGEDNNYRLKPNISEFEKSPAKWKQSHPVKIMVNHKLLNLLTHPLVRSWFDYKWESYARWIFAVMVFIQSTFVASQIYFLNTVHNWNWINSHYNMTRETFCADNKTEVRKEYYSSHAIFSTIILSSLTILSLIMECHNIWRMKKFYLKQVSRLLRCISIFLVVAALWPDMTCGLFYFKPVSAWLCGVLAFLLSCLNLINLINKLPSCAIFAILTPSFVYSYLRGIMLMSMIILTFSFLFNLLLKNNATDNFPIVFVRTVVWVFGDYSYESNFGSGSMVYPFVSNIVFLFFISIIGFFVISLIKAPASDPEELSFNTEATFANFMLNIDVLFPQLKKKNAIGKYSGKLEKSKIIMILENGLKYCKDKIYQIFPWVNYDEHIFTPSNQLQDKLDEQNALLDQILNYCRSLNEQNDNLKQSYLTQNEQISEIKKHLVSNKGMDIQD